MEKQKWVWPIGILAGLLNGLFGAGGGTLLVPALEKFRPLETHKAHATALAVVLPLSVVSALVYIWRAKAPMDAILFVSIGGIAGGFIGAKLLNKISSGWLNILFGIFLGAGAIRMLFDTASGGYDVAFAWFWYILIGFAAGVVSGLGIGGGAILIPAVTIIMGLGQREAQSINLLYFLPTAAVAIRTHAKSGNIEKKGLFKMVLLGLLGAMAGALIAVGIDSYYLRKGFAGFLLIMAVYELTRGVKVLNNTKKKGKPGACGLVRKMELKTFEKMKALFGSASTDEKIDMYVGAEGLTQTQYKELLLMFPLNELHRLEAALG